jgi:hypothetical protein
MRTEAVVYTSIASPAAAAPADAAAGAGAAVEAAADLLGFASASRVLLLLLTLALACFSRAGSQPLRADVTARLVARGAPPGAPPRALALLYFGHVGNVCREACSDADRLSDPLEPALGSAASVAAHVVAPALAAGWAVDTFLHTWDPLHAAPLRAQLRPANASFGAFRGATGGMVASIEAALELMEGHVVAARGGAPYDAALLLRFDTVFFAPFSLAALAAHPSAVFVAHWCKAGGAGPLPEGPPPAGLHGCYRLAPFWADEEGVPDFYFAGRPEPLLRLFKGLDGALRSGAVAPGRTCNSGCGHALVWGGVVARGVPLRRYLLHQVHLDLYRHRVCGSKWGALRGGAAAAAAAAAWLGGGAGDATPPGGGNESICGGGRFLCAWHEGETTRCGAFGHGEPRQFPPKHAL